MTQHNREVKEELKCQEKYTKKEVYPGKMYVLYCTGGIDLQGESIYNL